MPSIRDVAQLAGVSVATVSRALSNPEKVSKESLKKVNAAIDKIGYRPNLLARNFRSTRAYSIVVLVPDITNPFFSQVIKSIEDRAQQKGYAVLLGDTRDSSIREQEYVQRVETRLADGIIQLRPQPLKIQSEKPIPFVYACACEGLSGARIRVDNRMGAKQVVEHLLQLGHKRIGIFTGLDENPHNKERFEGYQLALKEANVELEEDLIYKGDFTLHSGQQNALKVLASNERPSAIFCMSDHMAIGAIQTFQSKGLKVPDDISVVGFDNIPFTEFWYPAITTLAQPFHEMGTAAVDILVSMIEDQDFSERDWVMPTEFKLRESTKKLES